MRKIFTPILMVCTAGVSADSLLRLPTADLSLISLFIKELSLMLICLESLLGCFLQFIQYHPRLLFLP